jgi:purine nucleosidase
VPHVWIFRRGIPVSLIVLCAVFLCAEIARAQSSSPQPTPKQLVIIDTDIGDDIDDAFALALAERSPELQILGVTTAIGDTTMRAQLTLRFLDATGFGNVPVAVGIATPAKTTFTQAPYATGGQSTRIEHLTGPDFILDQIRKHPGQITLIAIGPQTNLAAALDKDRATFRKLKRIVMMGGSVDRGYDDHTHPDPEWNIVCDIPAARKVFASGVPIYMMPLDATILNFDPARLDKLFATHTALSEQLQILYGYWSAATKLKTPTLFDPMAVAYAVQPSLCPTTPLHLSIDDQGDTVRSPGKPNVNACLKSDPNAFFDYYLSRTSAPR